MKALIATGIFPPEIGGPATYAKLMSDRLPEKGIETVVLPFRTVRHLPRVLRHFAYFFKVLAASRGADIIFTQDPVSTGIPVALAAYVARKKMVLRVAGDYAWEQAQQRYGVTDSIDDFQNRRYGLRVGIMRFFQRLAVRRADAVITPSDYFNRLVRGWLPEGAKDKVVTIYNGVEMGAAFERREKPEDKTIISAGRLVPWKGFDTLMLSLAKLPGWKLAIAGDGPDRERLVKLVNDNNLADRVTLLGSLPRPELFSRISESHVFALLSTFESFSFQLVEAMHIGVPIIAGDIGNISEIVEDGKDGLLIDPTDLDAFVAAVKRLDANTGFAWTLARNAEKKSERFSIENTLTGLVALFEKVLAVSNISAKNP